MVTPRIDGIDISHWNEITDWDLAFAYPLVSLKASEGKRGRDATFPARWAKLREKGVKYRGAYHWLTTGATVEEQVANVLDAVGELETGEFIQLDWEASPVPTSDMAIEFCDRVNWACHGVRTMTYSSDWLPDSTLDLDSRREFEEWREARPHDPLWYANYALTTVSSGGAAECAKYGADVWQWSSSKSVPGFSGRIDVNQVFNWQALDLVTNQLIIPEPEPVIQEEDDTMKILIHDPVWNGTFTMEGMPVSPEAEAALVAQGFVVVTQDHPFWRATVEARLGPEALRLYTLRAAGA